jgi:hypothetical protein
MKKLLTCLLLLSCTLHCQEVRRIEKISIKEKISNRITDELGTEIEVQKKLKEGTLTETALKQGKQRIVKEEVDKEVGVFAKSIEPMPIPMVEIKKLVMDITAVPYMRFVLMSAKEMKIWREKIQAIGIEGLGIAISKIKTEDIPKLAVIFQKTDGLSVPQLAVLLNRLETTDIDKLAILVQRTDGLTISQLSVLLHRLDVTDISKLAVLVQRTEGLSLPQLMVFINSVSITDIDRLYILFSKINVLDIESLTGILSNIQTTDITKIALLLSKMDILDTGELARHLNRVTGWYVNEREFYEAWKKKDVTAIRQMIEKYRIEQEGFFLAWGNYQNFSEINWSRQEIGYRQVLVSSISYDWKEKFKPNEDIILTINFGLDNVEIQALQEMIKENKDKIKLVILPWASGAKGNNYDNKDISTYAEVGEWGDRLFFTVKEVAPEIPVYLTVCWVDHTMKEWMVSFKAPYDGLALWNIDNTYKAPLQKIYDKLKGYNKNIILSGIFECSPDKNWIPWNEAKQLTLNNFNKAKEAGFRGVILMGKERDVK